MARWMDPSTGTFLSVDPVVPSASDPQSLNAYSYARNNPVNLTDPNGMCVTIFTCTGLMPGFYGSMWTQSSYTAQSIMREHGPKVDVFAVFNHDVASGGQTGTASVAYDMRTGNLAAIGVRLESTGPQAGTAGVTEVEALTSNQIPDAATRQSRGADGARIAKQLAPDADVKYVDRFGAPPIGDGPDAVEVSYATAAERAAAGADPVHGVTIPGRSGWVFGIGSTPTRIRLYIESTTGGTFRIHLPGGNSVIRTFSGNGYALFIGRHEAGHAVGLSGLEANRFALRPGP